MADPTLVLRLEQLLIEVTKLDLTPETIDPDRNYFHAEFGLTSLDALELMIHVEREFDIEIPDGYIRNLPHLSLNSFADYIEQLRA
jgi:acyl carrier protein